MLGRQEPLAHNTIGDSITLWGIGCITVLFVTFVPYNGSCWRWWGTGQAHLDQRCFDALEIFGLVTVAYIRVKQRATLTQDMWFHPKVAMVVISTVVNVRIVTIARRTTENWNTQQESGPYDCHGFRIKRLVCLCIWHDTERRLCEHTVFLV